MPRCYKKRIKDDALQLKQLDPFIGSLELQQRIAGSGSTARSRHRHYFKRESLHELVWTAPVVEVAKRLGVSDVGLAKLCRRAEIPTLSSTEFRK
jgi:hypothetical protein